MPTIDKIQFRKIYIENKMLMMTIDFNYYNFPYVGFLKFNNRSKNWSFQYVIHVDLKCCYACNEKLPIEKQSNIYCTYLMNQEYLPDSEEIVQIKKEILTDAIIAEKVRNFRLEAITHGFNY